MINSSSITAIIDAAKSQDDLMERLERAKVLFRDYNHNLDQYGEDLEKYGLGKGPFDWESSTESGLDPISYDMLYDIAKSSEGNKETVVTLLTMKVVYQELFNRAEIQLKESNRLLELAIKKPEEMG